MLTSAISAFFEDIRNSDMIFTMVAYEREIRSMNLQQIPVGLYPHGTVTRCSLPLRKTTNSGICNWTLKFYLLKPDVKNPQITTYFTYSIQFSLLFVLVLCSLS